MKLQQSNASFQASNKFATTRKKSASVPASPSFLTLSVGDLEEYGATHIVRRQGLVEVYGVLVKQPKTPSSAYAFKRLEFDVTDALPAKSLRGGGGGGGGGGSRSSSMIAYHRASEQALHSASSTAAPPAQLKCVL